jgi:hypothetical protein
MTRKVKEKLEEFLNTLIMEDVSTDKAKLKDWKEVLEG